MAQNNKKWFIKTWIRKYFGNELEPFEAWHRSLYTLPFFDFGFDDSDE
jgi:hypothetical protein